ncbi:MAG: sulfatase [Planctomycetales bacterium]|nr:sulfatase [Planctomycetales bacterium]
MLGLVKAAFRCERSCLQSSNYGMVMLCIGICSLALPTPSKASEQPNILLIMADDCTFRDLPLYGGQNARTPNLDAFARESLVFERAYLCSAMCQPCRAELYSGQYPMRNGCAWNHSASRSETRSLPHYFGDLGYRVGIAGKVHVLPQSAFPFESVDGYDDNCVRNPTKPHDINQVSAFMARDSKQPFCLVVALVEPHVPWVMGDPSAYPPETLKLPPNIADTELSRDAFSRYLAEITYMDNQVGEILAALELSGQAKNTIVMFTSEQGAQFPGCKWTNWDTGVHTALIARWPDHTLPGTRTHALVQYADVVPTLLEVAGQSADNKSLDGKSFLAVLEGQSQKHRQFVYGMHNNIPEGPAYPVRSVTDGEYHLIHNLTPHEIFIEKHLMGLQGDGLLNNPYWGTWVFSTEQKTKSYQLVKRYMLRPPVELYRLSDDPYEMNNLAGRTEVSEIQTRLTKELELWMQSQGDPGIEQDTPESHRAAKQGKHRFFPPAG